MNTRGLLRLAPIVLATSFVAACGGGSGGGSNNATAADSTKNEVAGPLDAIQQPLSEQVIGALAGAAEGTPLAPVLHCVDEAVVTDLIDVVDSIALAAEQSASGDPAAAFEAAAGNIQASLTGFADNMVALLTSLGGGPGCTEGGAGNGGDAGGSSGGPFPSTGTPLDVLIEALNGAIPSSGGDAGGEPSDVDLTDVGTFVSNLVAAFDNGYAMLQQQAPAEALSAPVVSGVIALLHDAVNDLDSLVTEVTAYQGQASADEAENLLNNLLNNVLLGVVPVLAFEEMSGQTGVVSDQVSGGVDQLTSAIGEGLGMLLVPVLEDGLDDAASVVLDPVENQLIHAIFGPINGAGGGDAGGPTDTPIDALLGALTGLSGGSGAGPTGTPLDILLTPLINGAESGDPVTLVLGLVNGVLSALSPTLGSVAYEASSGSLNPVLSPVAGGLYPVVFGVSELGADDAIFGNEIVLTVVDQVLAIVVGQL